MTIQDIIRNGPMLATTWEKQKHIYPMYAQPKYDGERAIFHQGEFYTRAGKRWASNRFTHIKRQLENVTRILDGELYIHGLPFQDLSGILAVHANQPHSEEGRVSYIMYDMCMDYYDFTSRFKMLCDLFTIPSPHLSISGIDYILTANHAHLVHKRNLADGYEGTIYRHGFGEYKLGRSPDLMKRKEFDDIEVVVTGKVLGQGKYKTMLGALTCMATIQDKQVRFNVGSGFNDKERAKFWEHMPVKILVRYQNLSKDGIPMKPIFKGVIC